MPNNEFNELVQVVRPPAPEVPTAERLARERQGIFYSHEPREALRGPESPAREFKPDSGPGACIPMGRSAVCVLDERGGHLKLGERCPHFADYDGETVTQITF